MAIFSVAAIGGTGIGPVAAGWIEANPRFEWRWIQYLHAMSVFHVVAISGLWLNEPYFCRATALCFVLCVIFMKETRNSVILTKRAKKLRKDTGDERFKAAAELELPSLKELLRISLTRTPRMSDRE